jgi:aldose sugar dehydrogenase
VRWRVETVVEGVNRPWSLNVLPDGRLLFNSRDTDALTLLDVATRRTTRVTGLPKPRTGGEAGHLGMAVDIDFARNRTLYVCHSATRNGPVNVLASYTLDDDRVTFVRSLLEMPGATYHNGCRVVMDSNGFLFVSMGDAQETALAQNRTSLAGKILRIARDGSIPPDNPIAGSAVWSLGHRNPQGLAFEPGSGLLWSTEHGSNTRDEVNVIRKGQNYGWPTCEGEQTPCSGVERYQAAVKEYDRDNTIAISDMMFYTGDAFPSWRNQLFFVALKTGRLYRAEVANGRIVRDAILIDNAHGRLRDVITGPDGFIYISTDNGDDSKILRLRPTT